MHNNYPISHEDQVKLIKDGWTLINASKKHKQIITITPDGESEVKPFDTQVDTGIEANKLAAQKRTIVALDGSLRKVSVVMLLEDGYTIIRPRMEVSSIFYCSSFGAWRALEYVDADRSMESAMNARLQDSKTIRY